MGIGVPGNGTFNRSVSFSQAVSNPYLFVTYFDAGTSFAFSQPFTLAQANKASLSGSTVTSTALVSDTDTVNDGFVVQMLGSYLTINFTHTNTSGTYQTVAFTTGISQVPNTPGAPVPLPLVGAGFAYGFSSRLRRRNRAGA